MVMLPVAGKRACVESYTGAIDRTASTGEDNMSNACLNKNCFFGFEVNGLRFCPAIAASMHSALKQHQRWSCYNARQLVPVWSCDPMTYDSLDGVITIRTCTLLLLLLLL